MVVQIPVVLYSGGYYPRGFRTLESNDTVPGTDTTAQASGNAALVRANTALVSGNAGISIGLTALASGNDALSLANLKLPLSGGVLTGDVILDNQVDVRFREATANGTNYVGFQAPASIAADVLWTLPATDGTAAQVLSTNGSGTLSWATAGSGDVTLTGTQTLTNKTLTLPIIDNIKGGFTSTPSPAPLTPLTTTLTVSSNRHQRFLGTGVHTVVLPVTSTLGVGISYEVENGSSTQNVIINSSGGNLVATVIPGTSVQCMCIGTTLTTAADWSARFNEFSTITGTGSSVLADSPTLVTPTVGGDVTINGQGDLRFADADSSNWVAFQAPATVAANVTWTLPAADGAPAQVLSTNGSGTLSWATAGGGESLSPFLLVGA